MYRLTPLQSASYRAALQKGAEGPEQCDNRPLARRVTHQADPPALAGQRPEPAADLDAEADPQLAPDLGVVDAVGQPHARELRAAGVPPRTGGSRARAARPGAGRRRGGGGRATRRALPRAARRARRAARRASRSARCGGSGARFPRSRRAARGRGTSSARAACALRMRSTARAEKLTGARPGGTPRHFCVPEYTASMPHASTSTGMPPSDVTVSTSRSVSVRCSAASGAISFSTPVDVSACTTASRRACGFARVRVEQLLRVDGTPPRLFDAHDLGAAPARDFAHALAEHAVHADDRGVARFEQVDEARFHARPNRCR